MSWDGYIASLMDCNVADAVIVGCEAGHESVWASYAGGTLGKMTPDEIRKLVASDRSSFFTAGVTFGGSKCTVLRDELFLENHTMDARSKATDQEPDSCSICVGKSKKALIIVKGQKGVHGGCLNKKVYEMAEHLKKSGY